MQVQWMDIERLVPYERNAKRHPEEQVGKIAASIEHFGWDQPIVVDERMEIIKGHGRYYAAERLGRDKAPVVVREDLTEEQKRAARLADNRTAESDWDWDLVSQELADLRELDLDVELTGFDAGEIEGLTPIERNGDERSGTSPWERMSSPGGEGVLFTCGDISCRISRTAYERLADSCPDSGIQNYIEEIIYAACGHH